VDSGLYQLWFAVRYIHVASVALLTGGAATLCALCVQPRGEVETAGAVLAATVYEWMFWSLVGITVVTGVSNLGLKGDGLMTPGLWALTWTTTRAGLRALESDDDDQVSGSIVMRLTVAGGWNGIGIFVALAFVFLFNLARHGTPAPTFVPLVVLGVAIGGSLAFTIGAVVGFVYGLVDAALLCGAAALLRWTRGDSVTSTR
jgi:hypothetical protein